MTFIIAAVSLSFESAELQAREPAVAFDSFPKGYPVILAFDLQQDEFPQAALIVNSTSNSPEADRNVSLPFKISDAKANEKGNFRIGAYESWTLITFSTRNQNIWPQGISFVPVIERSFEPESATDDGTKSVYLISEGQVRKFRYRYANSKSSKSFASVPADLKIDPDAIAIALPQGAREFAVRSGLLSVPSRLVPGEPVFPATAPGPNEQFLEINYQVPATDTQKLIVKWGVKALGAFLPIAGLFFLKAEHVRNNKLRWSVIIGGSLLFCIVLAGIIWAAYNSTDREDIIGDLLLCLGSASISGLIFWSKTNEK